MKARTKLMVLGSAQDGGVPQAGCYCPVCKRARANADCRRLAPSIAIYNEEAGFCYLIDASPDLSEQIDRIYEAIPRVNRGGKIPVSGILLTHAHIGHYAGLLQLGTEVIAEKGLPVYCTASMMEFLSISKPFSLLIENGNITLHEVRPNAGFIRDGVGFTPIAVPHRGETTDTVGYAIEAGRRAAYIPDTDRWTDSLIEEISRSDVALIDGTFYSREELPRFEEVPHPTIEGALGIFAGIDTEIYFTHINHTNPANAGGAQREKIERGGFRLAFDGMTLPI